VDTTLESAGQRHPELAKIVEAVKAGEPSPLVPVRRLLSWFHAQRRGFYVVQYIRSRLRALGVATDPDFDSVWIDSEIRLVPVDSESSPVSGHAAMIESDDQLSATAIVATPATMVGGGLDDPTYRIGKLEAANRGVVSVTPTQTTDQAVTLMLANGYSQLPVMQGQREVKGVISWESIGARLALDRTCKEARECMSSAQIIDSDKSLLAAIGIIAQHQYVLVQAPDKTISGIVTFTDLSLQFQQLTEPFLLLGEIEQHIRRLIDGKFTPVELKEAKDPSDTDREVESVADLSMGEYIRLLETPKYWQKLNLRIDRAIFIDELQSVRRIRNDIMHFDPDPLGKDDLSKLRKFVSLMQSLRELGVVQ